MLKMFVFPRQGEVELNYEELGLYPEFHYLANRTAEVGKNGIVERNKKELYFLYHYYYPTSAYAAFPGKEKKQFCLDAAGLPKDYPIDSALKKAMWRMKDIIDKMYPSVKLILNLRYTLIQSEKYIEAINKSISELDVNKTDDNGNNVGRMMLKVALNEVVELTKSVKSTTKMIKELEQEFLEELKNDTSRSKKGHGGYQISIGEEPDDEL